MDTFHNDANGIGWATADPAQAMPTPRHNLTAAGAAGQSFLYAIGGEAGC